MINNLISIYNLKSIKMVYLLITFLVLNPLSISAYKNKQIKVDVLKQGSDSWDGGKIKYLKGKAHITVAKISIPLNKKIAFHCHIIPLVAYVSKGAIEIATLSGEKKVFKKGEAFIEVMNKWHKGRAIKNTELIAFYAGNKGIPLAIHMNENSNLKNQCN